MAQAERKLTPIVQFKLDLLKSIQEPPPDGKGQGLTEKEKERLIANTRFSIWLDLKKWGLEAIANDILGIDPPKKTTIQDIH